MRRAIDRLIQHYIRLALAASTDKEMKLSPRYASLVALIVQEVVLVLMIRHSRKLNTGNVQYLVSTAVLATECIKIVFNALLMVVFRGKTSPRPSIFASDAIYLAVPALLYVIQNNLTFIALEHLSVPVYQVTNQGKLLTTALVTKFMLNRQFSSLQWLSLWLLACGVSMVQLSSLEEQHADTSAQSEVVGLMAITLACFTSGFAGVYFEKILKYSKSEASVYERNVQLGLFSIVLAFLPVAKDWNVVKENGFFVGYNHMVWGIVVGNALAGIIISLVMKYADNVIKGFANSIAFVLATILSMYLWGSRLDEWLVLGAAMVAGAVFMYSKYTLEYMTTKAKSIDAQVECTADSDSQSKV